MLLSTKEPKPIYYIKQHNETHYFIETVEEWYFGIIISNDLKYKKQFMFALSKTNSLRTDQKLIYLPD